MILIGIIIPLIAVLLYKHHQEQQLPDSPEIQSGIWGDMMVWDMDIHQPSEYTGFIKISAEGPSWNFGKNSEDRVRDILVAAGCSASEVQSLLASKNLEKDGSLVIRPPEKILTELGGEVRSKIYLELAKNKENVFQQNPYLVSTEKISTQLKKILPNAPDVEDLLRKLSYPRNGYTYFSDPELLLKKMGGGAKEKEVVLKLLTSLRCVMASILVKPNSSIDLPVIYWGYPMPGVRIKDLYPLFESQKLLAKGGSVPISFLLPEKARNLLYTTPLTSGRDQPPANCLSTSLFFFASDPDPRVSDPLFASKFLQEHYYSIARPNLAGDLVLLLDGKGYVVHAAVHLAGDIVFSKNGVSASQPWVLMHEKDMVGLFSALEPMRVCYVRWNDW